MQLSLLTLALAGVSSALVAPRVASGTVAPSGTVSAISGSGAVARRAPAPTAAPVLISGRSLPRFAEFEDLVSVSAPASSSCPASACITAAAAIPTCGTSCLLAAASGAGCTNPTDYGCQCSASAVIQSAAGACVLSACGFLEAIQVESSAAALCSCNAANPSTPCIPAATPSIVSSI